MRNRRIDRNTPCKPVSGVEWKSVDDYFANAEIRNSTAAAHRNSKRGRRNSAASLVVITQRVSVVDFDIPFVGRFLKIMFKWMGGRVRGFLLLPACHFCSLANCGGRYSPHYFSGRDVHFSSPVILLGLVLECGR